MYILDESEFELLNSNAAVENYPAWDSDSTYDKDERVIYNNRIYKSLIDNNNEEPENSLNWFNKGATNPYKCIDKYINTQTISEDDLVMEFSFKNADTIAFFNVYAKAVKIEIYTNDNNLVRTIEKDLLTNVNNWGDYFYRKEEYIERFFIKGSFMLVGKLKITLYKTDNVKVGILQIGNESDLGLTLEDVKSDIDDYSKKNIDENGNVYLKQGNYADRLDCEVICPTSKFNTIRNRLIKSRGKAFTWIASEDDKFRELNLYGYYENFSISVDNPEMLTCSLSLRGLV